MVTVSGSHKATELTQGARVNPGNWIALSREVREHPIVGAGQPVKPADDRRGAWSRMEAWFDLLCLAQYKPSRINNKGEMQALNVGQLMGARAYLAGRWNWTEKTVRGYLDVLEREGMISRGEQNYDELGQQKGQPKANKCSVITVCNYSRYQMLVDAVETYVRQAKGPAMSQQKASEGPAEGQNLTSKTTQQEKYSSCRHAAQDEVEVAFEDFWKAFPAERRRNKGKARDLFHQIVSGRQGKRRASSEVLVGAIRAGRGIDPNFPPMPETWLNGGRWEDEVPGGPPTPQPRQSFWWEDADKLASLGEEEWDRLIDKHANGAWPIDKLGFWPRDARCVVPKSVIMRRKLWDLYDDNGIARRELHAAALRVS